MSLHITTLSSYHMSLHMIGQNGGHHNIELIPKDIWYELNVVIPDTISALKMTFVSLFVGELVSYLGYLCLFVHSGVQHILAI